MKHMLLNKWIWIQKPAFYLNFKWKIFQLVYLVLIMSLDSIKHFIFSSILIIQSQIIM